MNFLNNFNTAKGSQSNNKYDYRQLAFIIGLLLITNVVTFKLFQSNFIQQRQVAQHQNDHHYNNNGHQAKYTNKSASLYLLDQAATYVYDVEAFERKVREVARGLDVPPEWLMAVMHSESRFDASVKNQLGSGATGLIQFMPTTAKEHNITTDKLRNMNHIEQLDYVYNYLNGYRQKYGDYKSLTSLYLGILYPKAIPEEYCYTLYASPSKAYKMNAGLDEDKDNRVTVMDIDKRMKRKYKTAYMVDKNNGEKQSFIGGFMNN